MTPDSTTPDIEKLQAENDALLKQVNEQVTLGSFEPTAPTMKHLVAGLGDPRGLVRLQFAETLGDIGEPATPFLIEALNPPAEVVLRRAVAKTLTIIADPEAVPALVDAFLNDEDTVVKGSAAGALARTGEAAVPDLLRILENPDHPEDIKGHAAWALAFMGSEAAEHLYQALNHASLDVRCAVIGALGHVAQEQVSQPAPNPKSAQLLIGALTDQEALIRTEAAAALGQINYPDAIPPLITALEDPALDVRKAAINSLGKLGAQPALDPLKTALDDEQEVIRVLAKLAIAQIERQSTEDDW